MIYRYSEWDGTQSIPNLDANQVLDALSDDLMNFGDLQHALRNLMQRGMRGQQGDRTQGLRDLLQQLRQQRRQRLDQFDLGGVMEDLKRQLKEILDLERQTLEERLAQQEQQQRDAQNGQDGQPDASGAPQQPGDSSDGSESGEGDDGQQGMQSPRGQQRQRGQGQRGQQQPGTQRPGQQHGQPSDESGEQGGSESGGQQGAAQSEQEQFEEMLRRIAERKQQFLDQLPQDTAGQMKDLQNYEFLNPDAQSRFQELVDQLKQAMTNSFFKDFGASFHISDFNNLGSIFGINNGRTSRHTNHKILQRRCENCVKHST